MGKSLIIVESPAKVKTIKKFLGPGYLVQASVGHIRDLPKSNIGVDEANDFAPEYEIIQGKEKVVQSLRDAASKVDTVFLAPDPDREGEAIAWHVAELLKDKNPNIKRIQFNEITSRAVHEALDHPRDLNVNLFDAQQARRVLDRLVGYKISPLLWKNVKRGISAGRVQSVALRLIVEREEERSSENADPEENLEKEPEGIPPPFKAELWKVEGKKPVVPNAETADALEKAMKGAPFTVSAIEEKERSRAPMPPFITSTLQQAANQRLSYPAKRTMNIAQRLYEGLELGDRGTTALITYMRTDSLRIADEAQAAAKEFITETYGPEYVCPQKRTYKSKSATAAQDAHEAVRPTNPALTPAEVEKSVSGDPAKLYRLIWSRFIASQMSDCQQDTVSADITAAGYLFRASGYVVTFDGFTTLYEEATDEKEKKETALPPLEEGMVLKLRELKPEQKFTQPPARYTEATLIKALEENGIGRPSTYAPIITTIIDRDYVERDQKKLAPTTLGRVINELMLEQFPNIVDVKFSAHMEEELDTIENGKTDWHEVIDDFYTDFDKTLKEAEVKMEGKRIKVPDEETDEVCELCGRKMVIKSGRYGKFLACPGFPECKNTKRLVKDTGGLCPKCGSRMLVRHSKKGRVYYGCEKNPTCDFMTWNEPTTEKCPECGSTLFKKGGKNGILLCEKEGCGYSRALGAEKKE